MNKIYLLLLLLCMTPAHLKAETIEDYQAEINTMATGHYTSQELSKKITEFYLKLSNSFENLVVGGDEYNPDKVDYVSVLLDSLGPLADGESNMTCNAYQNMLMCGYRIDDWEEMPEAVHDCWKLMSKICKHEE